MGLERHRALTQRQAPRRSGRERDERPQVEVPLADERHDQKHTDDL